MRRRVVFAVTNDDRGDGALRKFSKDDVGSRQQMDGGRDDADADVGRHQAKRGPQLPHLAYDRRRDPLVTQQR